MGSVSGGATHQAGGDGRTEDRWFHQDEQGDWVAELECGHGQHVRHRSPWELRPWVLSEAA